MATETDLLELEYDDLQNLVVEWGQPAYRADQIWKWLYVSLAASSREMTNLPKVLRTRFLNDTRVGSLVPVARHGSSDGQTLKWLFNIQPIARDPHVEGNAGRIQIETVLMSYERRRTACISTQAGCGMGCTFCATGQMGLQRNLTAGEIVSQVLFVARELARKNKRLTNVVLMGMGEPLANYDATVAALRRLTDPQGLNFGQRRMTLSTVGVVPAIERFSHEDLQVGLAVSLHAATDELRDRLVPINRRYPLDRLMTACRDYVAHTHRRISFEWALIEGINDSTDQARALAKHVKGMLCHVNLIPLNPTSGYSGAPSRAERVATFRAELERGGVSTTVRVRRGVDIQAGCGQLCQRENHDAQGVDAIIPPISQGWAGPSRAV